MQAIISFRIDYTKFRKIKEKGEIGEKNMRKGKKHPHNKAALYLASST